MQGFTHKRPIHWLLLVILWALCCLPNLGTPSLWDIDEGNNATCAYEMASSNNWVIPTFNYELRTDKPALLYWLQISCYKLLGVNETAARLPSALAALLTTLVVYELGRKMFGPATGLLAAIILIGSIGLLGAAHFANPDALLVAFTTLTLALIWRDQTDSPRRFLAAIGIASGLAVLAKGPIGVLAPLGISIVYFTWQRRWRRLLDWRVGDLLLTFILVAAPWYIWVTVETRGQWIKGFWLRHHAERMTTAMESHSGPIYYYLIVLLVGLVPWSIFLGPTVYHTWQRLRQSGDDRPAVRFLTIWAVAYLVFFTIVRTKLPNYILPAYPAVALLTAHTLHRWVRDDWTMPNWMPRLSFLSLSLIGVGLGFALLIASGRVEPLHFRNRVYPELGNWCWLGLIPMVGAALASWLLDHNKRLGALASVALVGILLGSLIGSGGILSVEPYKATRTLAAALPQDHLDRDVRIATYRYFQPSLVFYSHREVRQLDNADAVLHFLRNPLESYVFIPQSVWYDQIHSRTSPQVRILAVQPDLYTGKSILLVGKPAESPQLRSTARR